MFHSRGNLQAGQLNSHLRLDVSAICGSCMHANASKKIRRTMAGSSWDTQRDKRVFQPHLPVLPVKVQTRIFPGPELESGNGLPSSNAQPSTG